MPRDIAASYANVREMAEQLNLNADPYRRTTEIAGLGLGHQRQVWREIRTKLPHSLRREEERPRA